MVVEDPIFEVAQGSTGEMLEGGNIRKLMAGDTVLEVSGRRHYTVGAVGSRHCSSG